MIDEIGRINKFLDLELPSWKSKILAYLEPWQLELRQTTAHKTGLFATILAT